MWGSPMVVLPSYPEFPSSLTSATRKMWRGEAPLRSIADPGRATGTRCPAVYVSDDVDAATAGGRRRAWRSAITALKPTIVSSATTCAVRRLPSHEPPI